MSVRFSRMSRFLLAFIWSICISLALPAWAASTSTTTALTLSSNGVSIAQNGSIASSSVITLTATVTADTTPVTVGSVSFCDATVPLCSDIHLIGTAQITPAGTAVFKFIPGIGPHSYKAVFAATPNAATPYAASSSSTSTITVTGTYPTTSTLTSAGSAGNYSLTSTVVGIENPAANPSLTGTVSFIDTTNANSVLATQSVSGAVSSLVFFDADTPATGQFPDSNVIADFNGDGIPDVAIANYSDGTLTILLGKGDGTFTPAPGAPISGLFDPNHLVIGDFNHDGKLDIAMGTSYYNGAVTILLGNGDGSFTPAPGASITVGNSFQSVISLATGDFNGDGVQDIAVGVSNNGSGMQYGGVLVVLLGKGDGTFQQLPAANLVQNPFLTTGDFNRDGLTDLAIVDFYVNDIAIYLGVGNGTFQEAPKSPLTVGLEADGVVAADLNGDGILDLAVSDMVNIASNGTVTILLGAGDGTFTPASTSPTVGVNPNNIAFGDFNGDGKTDLATSNNADDTVSYLLGNGDGTFQPVLTSAYLGQFTTWFATGDVNGDGLTDAIAVTQSTPSGNTNNFDGIASVLLSQPTVTTTALVNDINPIGTGTHQIQASYPGNSVYSPSTSNLVALTAEPAPPSITITSSTPSNVTPGATTTSTLTVTPAGGFTGTIALAAALTSSPASAVDLPTFSFGSASTVNITGATPATATLTISTSPASNASVRFHPLFRTVKNGTLLACLLVFLFPIRSRKRATTLALTFLFALFIASLSGCSSNNSSQASTDPGTTPGSYTVTVTGTSGTLTTTNVITFTVQ
jgi:hypothetical protein